MEYEYRQQGSITIRVRKQQPKQNGMRLQDEYGRFYYSGYEKHHAAGNMVKLFLWFTREDKELGTILFHRQWLHGSNSFPRKGPKKWIKFLEKNLDNVIGKAIRKLNKEYKTNTVQLVSIEGWQIINKKIINLKDCKVYDPPPVIRIKNGT